MNLKDVYIKTDQVLTNVDLNIYLELINVIELLLKNNYDVFIDTNRDPDKCKVALHIFGEFNEEEFDNLFDISILFERFGISLFLYNTLTLAKDDGDNTFTLEKMNIIPYLYLDGDHLSDYSLEILEKIYSE